MANFAGTFHAQIFRRINFRCKRNARACRCVGADERRGEKVSCGSGTHHRVVEIGRANFSKSLSIIQHTKNNNISFKHLLRLDCRSRTSYYLIVIHLVTQISIRRWATETNSLHFKFLVVPESSKTEDTKEESAGLVEPNPETELNNSDDNTSEVKKERNVEEDVKRMSEERWPNVNGVYDAQGEWHEWNEITYSYSYENSELIILPYTVCLINLCGQQYVTESTSN
jgi:hypothetical protein